MLITALCVIPVFAGIDGSETFEEYLIKTKGAESVITVTKEQEALMKGIVASVAKDMDLSSYDSVALTENGILSAYLYDNDTYDVITFLLFGDKDGMQEAFDALCANADENGAVNISDRPLIYMADLNGGNLTGIYKAGKAAGYFYVMSAVI